MYIATLFLPSRLIVRSTASLSIKRVINIDPGFARELTHVKWTITKDDGHRRLLVADTKTVLAFDMDDEAWDLRISEGLGGVRQVEWSACGGQILVWADFQLKLTVWSIMTSSASIIPNPKFPVKGFSYRPGRQDQAVLLQRTSHDSVSVLHMSSSSWTIQKTFVVATSDAQGVQWSPDGKWLAVWDNMIDYRVLIYTPDGRLVRTFIAYDLGLGVKTLSWSPTSEYLAIGSYDNKVRFLNNLTFSPSIELSHVTTVRSRTTSVWRQVNSGHVPRYEAVEQAISPPFQKHNVGEAAAKLGVGLLAFSPSGYFLATRCDSMPTTIWIWSLRELSPIAILVHTNAVRHMEWHPEEAGQLVFTCHGPNLSDNNAIYMWNIHWACPRIVSVPRDGFEVKWFQIIRNQAEEETGILLGSGESFTIGYPVPEGSADGNGTILEEEEEEEEDAGTVDDNSKIGHDVTGSIALLQTSLLIHAVDDRQVSPTKMIAQRPLMVL